MHELMRREASKPTVIPQDGSSRGRRGGRGGRGRGSGGGRGRGRSKPAAGDPAPDAMEEAASEHSDDEVVLKRPAAKLSAGAAKKQSEGEEPPAKKLRAPRATRLPDEIAAQGLFPQLEDYRATPPNG